MGTKKRILLVLVILMGILSACRLPEPVIPEIVEKTEDKVVEEVENTYYATTVYTPEVLVAIELENWMLSDIVRKRQQGETLVYGDFVRFRLSLDEDENTPENANRYTTRTIELLVTWEEGVEPKADTPITSAVVSLLSDPSISADMLEEGVVSVLSHLTPKPKGK